MEWLNLEDLATYLNCSKGKIRQYIYRKAIPVYQMGRQYKFKRVEIDTWMNDNKLCQVKRG